MAWNGSTAAALSVVVKYQFAGLSQAADNPPASNGATAGLSIPLKRRLLDNNSAPVTGLASTSVKITVAGLSCTDGTTLDQIEEYATGNSGLQKLGDSYYQWNWASPKTYANSCKFLKLDLGEGTANQHPALFQFK